MRVELRALQHRLGVTSLYVTHDQEEALAISDRVIVMNVGGIEQIGTPEDIYNRPKTRFVADFVGSANLISGRVVDGASGPGPIDFDAIGGVKLRAWAPHSPRGGETTSPCARPISTWPKAMPRTPRMGRPTKLAERYASVCSTAISSSTSWTGRAVR